MDNYWSTKTQLWENDLTGDNYDTLMNHLHGDIFAKFLAEIGLTAYYANKFLIDAICYINQHEEEFDT
jgi:hypothetical protein